MFYKIIQIPVKIKDDTLIEQTIISYVPEALGKLHTDHLADQTIAPLFTQPTSSAAISIVIGLHTQLPGFAVHLITNYVPAGLTQQDIAQTISYLRDITKTRSPLFDIGHVKSILNRRNIVTAIQTYSAAPAINPSQLITTINARYAQKMYATPKPIDLATEEIYIRKLRIGLLLNPHCITTTATQVHDLMCGQGNPLPVIPKYITENKIALPLFIDKALYRSGTLAVPQAYMHQAGILGQILNDITARYVSNQSVFSPAVANPNGSIPTHRQYMLHTIDGYLTAVTGISFLERVIRIIANDYSTKKVLSIGICTPVQNPTLAAALEPIFARDELGIRDGLAHGLHSMWQNPRVFNFMTSTIMHALNILQASHPLIPASTSTPSLSAAELNFATSFLVSNNVLTIIPSPSTFMSQVTARYRQLAPEKTILGQGLMYLFFSLQKSSKNNQNVSPTEVYITAISALILFEELLRAKATLQGITTLIVAGPTNNKLCPEYKMLDTTSNGLLNPTLIPQLLGTLTPSEQTALDILRKFRDELLHGELYGLTDLFSAAHLAIYFAAKLI